MFVVKSQDRANVVLLSRWGTGIAYAGYVLM